MWKMSVTSKNYVESSSGRIAKLKGFFSKKSTKNDFQHSIILASGTNPLTSTQHPVGEVIINILTTNEVEVSANFNSYHALNESKNKIGEQFIDELNVKEAYFVLKPGAVNSQHIQEAIQNLTLGLNLPKDFWQTLEQLTSSSPQVGYHN